jgi:hypothetical protein
VYISCVLYQSKDLFSFEEPSLSKLLHFFIQFIQYKTQNFCIITKMQELEEAQDISPQTCELSVSCNPSNNLNNDEGADRGRSSFIQKSDRNAAKLEEENRMLVEQVQRV